MRRRCAATVCSPRCCAKGDRPAFGRLVECYYDRLYRWLYQLTHDRHAAEDLTQETFLKAFRQLKGFEERANFSTWLYRIAVNCALDLMRKRKRHDEHQEPDELDYERGVPNARARTSARAFRRRRGTRRRTPRRWPS